MTPLEENLWPVIRTVIAAHGDTIRATEIEGGYVLENDSVSQKAWISREKACASPAGMLMELEQAFTEIERGCPCKNVVHI